MVIPGRTLTSLQAIKDFATANALPMPALRKSDFMRLISQPLVVGMAGVPDARIVGFINFKSYKACQNTLDSYASRLHRVLTALPTIGCEANLHCLAPKNLIDLSHIFTDIKTTPFLRRTSTWNHTATVLLEFFRWEVKHGNRLSTNSMELIEHSSKIAMFNDLMAALPETRVRNTVIHCKPIPHEDIDKIKSCLPLPFPVMIDWQVATGLRAFEVCNLKVEILIAIEAEWERGNRVAMFRTIRKGGAHANAYAPIKLQELTRHYRDVFRPSRVGRTGHHGFYFIDSRGNHIDTKSYIKKISAAAESLGIKQRSHSFRATFAQNVHDNASAMAANGAPIAPLLVTKELMNHRNSSTTEKYLNEISCADFDITELLKS